MTRGIAIAPRGSKRSPPFRLGSRSETLATCLPASDCGPARCAASSLAATNRGPKTPAAANAAPAAANVRMWKASPIFAQSPCDCLVAGLSSRRQGRAPRRALPTRCRSRWWVNASCRSCRRLCTTSAGRSRPIRELRQVAPEMAGYCGSGRPNPRATASRAARGTGAASPPIRCESASRPRCRSRGARRRHAYTDL